MPVRRLKIFFDGGARPNPGRIEVAVVAGGRTWLFDDRGEGSSTEAEWHALIAALEVAGELGAADFVLLGDSAEVTAAAAGGGGPRAPALRSRYEALAGATPLRIRKIARTQNLAGIALEARRR